MTFLDNGLKDERNEHGYPSLLDTEFTKMEKRLKEKEFKCKVLVTITVFVFIINVNYREV